MTPAIPQTILLSCIDLGIRGRTQYRGIEELAESIEHNGLVQPLVLAQKGWDMPYDPADIDGISPTFSLVAGGRRYHALLSLGVTELHHGATSTPGRPGFVLRDEPGTVLSNLLIELAENLDRHEVDWKDNCRMIVKAAALARREGFAHGVRILQHDLGAILGCSQQDIRAAEAVVMDLDANPQDYADCVSVRGAYVILLKKNAVELQKQYALRSISVPGQVGPSKTEGGENNAEPPIQEAAGYVMGETVPASTVIPLTTHFFHRSGLEWMTQHLHAVDHIITDPDFALDRETLAVKGWAPDSSSVGVAQREAGQSLAELEFFLHSAYETLKPQGFLVFFYDLDHHEKLQSWASAAGFAVQRWPLIWHKTDARGNASPQSNFCKNVEYAMVCRKPGSTLANVQMSTIVSIPTASATKDFGHPFAKPKDLWKFIFNAVAIKGQTILDPFAGSGSCPVSALEWGLRPIGCEIQEQHYHSLLLNLQACYRKLVPGPLVFQ